MRESFIDKDTKPGLRDRVRNRLNSHRSEWEYSPSRRLSIIKRDVLLAVGAALVCILSSVDCSSKQAQTPEVTPSGSERSAIIRYRANILQENPLSPVIRYITGLPPQISLGR